MEHLRYYYYYYYYYYGQEIGVSCKLRLLIYSVYYLKLELKIIYIT